jgi:hypothetical protein
MAWTPLLRQHLYVCTSKASKFEYLEPADSALRAAIHAIHALELLLVLLRAAAFHIGRESFVLQRNHLGAVAVAWQNAERYEVVDKRRVVFVCKMDDSADNQVHILLLQRRHQPEVYQRDLALCLVSHLHDVARVRVGMEKTHLQKLC